MDLNLYKDNEVKANKFNLICLLVISLLGVLVIIINRAGFFSLQGQAPDMDVIDAGIIILIINYSLPLLLYVIHDKLIKNQKNPIIQNSKFKILILICAYFGLIDVCILLSHHVVLLITILPLMAAQYKHDKKIFIFVIITSLISIPLIIYGNYFLGIYDRNIHKGLTEAEAESLKNRLEFITGKRLVEIDTIAYSITRRNTNMIQVQTSLNEQVIKETEAKNHMQSAVIEDLADVIETRDIETGEHIKRTKKYVSILAHKMLEDDYFKDKITLHDVELMEKAAPLHDIGKIAVSDLILLKPGKLTNEEHDKMKEHTTKGGDMIKHILSNLGDDEFLQVSYDIALSHHEKWNGSGYPNNLKEEEIPLAARVMAVADVFDALVAKRVYKDPFPIDKAINIILEESGSHFDPEIIRIFDSVKDEFIKVATE